jgi:hypothetical protein
LRKTWEFHVNAVEPEGDGFLLPGGGSEEVAAIPADPAGEIAPGTADGGLLIHGEFD